MRGRTSGLAWRGLGQAVRRRTGSGIASRIRVGEIGSSAAVAGRVLADADALEAWLSDQGIACVRADRGPYPKRLFEQEWAREQGLVVDVSDSLVGPYTRYGPQLASARPVSLGGAFAAGTNTRSILAELGYSSSQIESLLAGKVVSEAPPIRGASAFACGFRKRWRRGSPIARSGGALRGRDRGRAPSVRHLERRLVRGQFEADFASVVFPGPVFGKTGGSRSGSAAFRARRRSSTR